MKTITLKTRTIPYYPELANYTVNDIKIGVKGALLFAQIVYWQNIMIEAGNSNDGVFYKSNAEMMQETGLTQKELRNARDIIEASGLIRTWVKAVSNTRCVFYKVLVSISIESLHFSTAQKAQPKRPKGKTKTPNGHNQNALKALSSITQEDTQEDTQDIPATPKIVNSDFKELSSFFINLHTTETGEPPLIDFGRHGKCVNDLLKVATIEAIKAKAYLLRDKRNSGDKFWASNGLTAIDVKTHYNRLIGVVEVKHPEREKLEKELGL